MKYSSESFRVPLIRADMQRCFDRLISWGGEKFVRKKAIGVSTPYM